MILHGRNLTQAERSPLVHSEVSRFVVRQPAVLSWLEQNGAEPETLSLCIEQAAIFDRAFCEKWGFLPPTIPKHVFASQPALFNDELVHWIARNVSKEVWLDPEQERLALVTLASYCSAVESCFAGEREEELV